MAEPEEKTADKHAEDTSSALPNDEHAEAGTSSMTPATEGGVGKDEEADKTVPADETADDAARKADTDDTSNSPGSGTTEVKDNDSNKNEPKIKEDKTEEPIAEEQEKTDDKKAADAPEELEKPVPAVATPDDAGKKPNDLSTGPIVSSSKRTRPPYKYDPEKVFLRFLFANRDGLTVTVECKPADTVGEVKAQLLSVWPDGK